MTTRKSRIAWAALPLTLVVAISASACAGATKAPTAGGSASKSGPLTIGVTIHQADQYFQTVFNGVASAVKANKGSSTLVNTQTDPGIEATGVQNLISSKVTGIVMSPLSPTGSLASMKAAHDAGIPIVCYNTCLSDADNSKYAVAFIESDQTDLGTQTGAFAAKDLQAKNITTANVGMLNCNRYEACKDRQRGFLAALKAGGITVNVLADQEALDPDKAVKTTTDILTAHPNIDVFWCASQGASEGMVASIKASGKKGISEYGTDVSPTLVQAIKDGQLRALTGQDATKTGKLAVEYLQKAINGETITPFVTKISGNLFDISHKEVLDTYLAANK